MPDLSGDPTANVIAIIEAAVKRQDDLRTSESLHVREVAALRAAHANDLRIAETARIDAIRAVVAGAVNRAAEVSGTQAVTLAAQVATSAETLRTQVAAAAQAATVALAAALEPIQKDIADLRRVQYEAAGVRTQAAESNTNSRSSAGLIIAAISLGSAMVLGVAGIAITLLLR